MKVKMTKAKNITLTPEQQEWELELVHQEIAEAVVAERWRCAKIVEAYRLCGISLAPGVVKTIIVMILGGK